MPNVDMSSIKNPKAYEALKQRGMSKMKAAKISNSMMKAIYGVKRSTPPIRQSRTSDT